MRKLVSKLRIGEQIGIGFGVVGLLFLLVIWRYHLTLEGALADYRLLQDVYQAKEAETAEIESSLLLANGEANGFLTDRDPARLARLDEAVDRLLERADRLGAIDPQGQASAARIALLARAYQDRFHDIYRAWERKGLDHDSGLQGAFRDSVHELEALAGHYKVDSLYVDLLQIRRGEKDLGLRRDTAYQQRVLELIDGLSAKLAASALAPEVRDRLTAELEVYRKAFLAYAQEVLADADIHGGKGPFRQSAHRIEELLLAHRVPDMEVRILQLRRREKDYLLRLDTRYVDMALAEWTRIDESVRNSAIADAEKARLSVLLDDYRRDFLALVEQNGSIDRLQQEMQQAEEEVLSRSDAIGQEANRAAVAAAEKINREVETNARLMGWIVLFAVVLGALFTLVITRAISRPLIEMAGFLDRLAFEAPVGRIGATPGSRSEVDAMADSVNRMADHKARMLAWWNSSLGELEAERDRLATRGQGAEGAAETDASEAAAAQTWQAAAGERVRLLHTSHQEMQREAKRIDELANGLGKAGQAISTAAREILSRLDIILRKQ